MKDLFDENNSGAHFSECGKYRYSLWRFWDNSLPKVLCIGLTPSNANAKKNDPTITNLITMLKQLGYGGFYMMNLFAFISSKPADLLTCADPIGTNDNELKIIRGKCKDVIVCWGNFKQATERIKTVLPMFPDSKCFGVNKNGTPFHHPLAMMYKGQVKSATLQNYIQ